jgi:hypothetical protein
MRGVKDNGINTNVLRGLIIVQMVNVRQPSLQPMITTLNKKHALGHRIEVRIGKQEKFKTLILRHLMLILRKHVLLLEFLLPFSN